MQFFSGTKCCQSNRTSIISYLIGQTSHSFFLNLPLFTCYTAYCCYHSSSLFSIFFWLSSSSSSFSVSTSIKSYAFNDSYTHSFFAFRSAFCFTLGESSDRNILSPVVISGLLVTFGCSFVRQLKASASDFASKPRRLVFTWRMDSLFNTCFDFLSPAAINPHVIRIFFNS